MAGVLCQLDSKRDGSFMPFVRAGWWVALPWALGEEIIIGHGGPLDIWTCE